MAVIDDFTADRSSRMIAEAYRERCACCCSAQCIKPTGQHVVFQMENNSKRTTEAAKEHVVVKICNIYEVVT